jgi:hypothetical protein
MAAESKPNGDNMINTSRGTEQEFARRKLWGLLQQTCQEKCAERTTVKEGIWLLEGILKDDTFMCELHEVH